MIVKTNKPSNKKTNHQTKKQTIKQIPNRMDFNLILLALCFLFFVFFLLLFYMLMASIIMCELVYTHKGCKIHLFSMSKERRIRSAIWIITKKIKRKISLWARWGQSYSSFNF